MAAVFSSSSVEAKEPSVSALISCNDACVDQVTFGCLVSNFFPQPATVTWSPATVGTSETFPAVQSKSSYFTFSSQLAKVPVAGLEDQTFQCQVQHDGNTITRTINGGDLCHSPVDVKLLGDPMVYRNQSQVLLMCLVEGKKANTATVEWLINEKVVDLGQEDFSCDKCSDNVGTFTSQVNVSQQSWDLGSEFSCKVTHSSLKEPTVVDISTFCGVTPELEVTILPPSLEDLYLSQNANITCVATNVKPDMEVKFSWNRESGGTVDATMGTPEKMENNLLRLTSTLKLCADEWNSGEKFTCTVSIPDLDVSVTKSIKKDNSATVRQPLVYVFPPPAEEVANQEMVTLTCLATGFLPRDILITWTQQDRPVSSQEFYNFGPKKVGGTFSAYSMLQVPASDWTRGDSFACVVGHDGIALNFIQKSLDKSSGKPTQVNVSVILEDSDVTCY